MAELLPDVAIPLGGGLRPGGPAAAPVRRGDGAGDGRGGPAPGAVAPGRDAHHLELHRASVAHAADGVRRGDAGAERLGAGPGAPAADLLAGAAGAARGHSRSAGCSTKGRSGGSAWRWSGRPGWRLSGRRVLEVCGLPHADRPDPVTAADRTSAASGTDVGGLSMISHRSSLTVCDRRHRLPPA